MRAAILAALVLCGCATVAPVYTAAYARPGRMRAGCAYFASFPKTAAVFADLSRRRLTMPVLTIGGAKAFGDLLGQQAKLVAADVTVVVLDDTGHWLLEERRKETTEALLRFLSSNGKE